VTRKLSVGLLALALVALFVGLRVAGSGGPATRTGCAGVRDSYGRASAIEQGSRVATSATYVAVARTARQQAATAPPAVAPAVAQLADAYLRIGKLLDGFDPHDEATYHVYEDHTGAIERQQSRVDAALPAIGDWLGSRCA
jgi:hypothetical protein